jgi:hypothetical protein
MWDRRGRRTAVTAVRGRVAVVAGRPRGVSGAFARNPGKDRQVDQEGPRKVVALICLVEARGLRAAGHTAGLLPKWVPYFDGTMRLPGAVLGLGGSLGAQTTPPGFPQEG